MTEHTEGEQRAESREQNAETEQRHESREHIEKHSEQSHQDQERPAESIDVIRQKINEEEAKTAEIRFDAKAEDDNKHPLYINGQLKSEALRRTLNRARKHLSGPDRVLSKAIHQPTVDAISKVAEQTIARPTGLLTGSILALAGSSFLLWSAKHYGYRYNYLTVLLLFVAGYAAGLVIELGMYALRRHHQK